VVLRFCSLTNCQFQQPSHVLLVLASSPQCVGAACCHLLLVLWGNIGRVVLPVESYLSQVLLVVGRGGCIPGLMLLASLDNSRQWQWHYTHIVALALYVVCDGVTAWR